MSALVKALLVLLVITIPISIFSYYKYPDLRSGIGGFIPSFQQKTDPAAQPNTSELPSLEEVVKSSYKPAKIGEGFCKSSSLIISDNPQNSKVVFNDVVYDQATYLKGRVSADTTCTTDKSVAISWLKNGSNWLDSNKNLLKYVEDPRPKIVIDNDLIEIESISGFFTPSGMDKLYCKSDLIMYNLGSPNFTQHKKVTYDAYYFPKSWVSKNSECTTSSSKFETWFKDGYSMLSSGGELSSYNSDTRPDTAKKYDMIPITELNNYTYPNQMDKLYCVAKKIFLSSSNGELVEDKVFFDSYYFPSIWVTKEATCSTSYKKLYDKYKNTEYGFMGSGAGEEIKRHY